MPTKGEDHSHRSSGIKDRERTWAKNGFSVIKLMIIMQLKSLKLMTSNNRKKGSEETDKFTI